MINILQINVGLSYLTIFVTSSYCSFLFYNCNPIIQKEILKFLQTGRQYNEFEKQLFKPVFLHINQF